MGDQYYISLTLSPRERNMVLRLLEGDHSDLAQRLEQQIEHLLREAREGADRDRTQKDRSRRLDAARVVARVFAERHAGSFPGSRGQINQNVERWVERQAEVALGVGSDVNLPNIRSEYRSRVHMALAALLDELQTPEGMRRAASFEARRLRALAADSKANPRFADPRYEAEQSERLEAEADELDRTGIVPGLLTLRDHSD